jgi:hypothetical protein
VTSFSANYLDCAIILGDVVIQGNVSFLGMEQLVEIQGTYVAAEMVSAMGYRMIS